MFKKLKEVAEGRVNLLTVKTTAAWLEREPEPNLHIVIDDTMEALTSSGDRKEHFKTASTWLKEQLEKWQNPLVSKIEVATAEHPLEVVCGDVAPILVIKGKKYLVSFFRDIEPVGWLVPGGCPRNREELLNPRQLAVRECGEELLIGDKRGRIYNFLPSSAEVIETIQAWKLEPVDFISLSPKELPPAKGHAQNLVMEYHDTKKWTKNVNVTIDHQTASVAITLYWEINLPIGLEELRIFDGEKTGALINRPIRLTTEDGVLAAIFSRGENILSAGWITEAEKGRAIIPK